jgi:hypothetical protein
VSSRAHGKNGVGGAGGADQQCAAAEPSPRMGQPVGCLTRVPTAFWGSSKPPLEIQAGGASLYATRSPQTAARRRCGSPIKTGRRSPTHPRARKQAQRERLTETEARASPRTLQDRAVARPTEVVDDLGADVTLTRIIRIGRRLPPLSPLHPCTWRTALAQWTRRSSCSASPKCALSATAPDHGVLFSLTAAVPPTRRGPVPSTRLIFVTAPFDVDKKGGSKRREAKLPRDAVRCR